MNPGQYITLQIANVIWFLIMLITMPLWIIPVILIAAAVGGFKYFWWFFKICYVSFRSVFKLPQCVEQTTLCISAIKKSERWSNMR